MFPAYLRDEGLSGFGGKRRKQPNLSAGAQTYLEETGATVQDLFYHVLEVLHDPRYHEVNTDALRLDWPRIPVPGWPRGGSQQGGEALLASADKGRHLARLLDTDSSIPGVTVGGLDPLIQSIAVPCTTDGHHMTDTDFAVTVGWGHLGAGHAVMPGSGRAIERPFTADERTAFVNSRAVLGRTTFDIYLNSRAYWRNVPARVWSYKLGGYQVLKKWLSYRERVVLRRPLHPAEVEHFTESARRIAAILRFGYHQPSSETPTRRNSTEER